jgi:lipopolysaccharide transport system ATP-binding protein
MALQMSSDDVVSISSVRKTYRTYKKPIDRLKSSFLLYLVKIVPFYGIASRITIMAENMARNHNALTDISFQIKRGESVGIIGLNGSGKSTLLQIISGIIYPTNGEVSVRGRVAALLELGSGFDPEFTGRENIYMNGQLYGLTRDEIKILFPKIEAFADIGEYIDQPVKSYSSGMYVRLAFSVVAHIDPDILIVDEALSVGDALFTQKCIRFLNKFKKTGTLLFVSHDSSSIMSLCSRCIWLDKGSLIIDDEVSKVMKSYHARNLEKMGAQFRNEATDTNVPSKALIDSEFPTILNFSKISNFNFDAKYVGEGKAKIIHAEFRDVHKQQISILTGGSRIELVSIVKFNEDVAPVLVGFSFKNKRGQVIFEQNISDILKDRMPEAKKNEVLKFIFEFKLPLLMSGDYFVDLAVAEGEQQSHVQQQWIYEAMKVTVSTKESVYGFLALEDAGVNYEYI